MQYWYFEPVGNSSGRANAERIVRSVRAFPCGERRTERVVAAARERALLLYSSTGHVDGTDGDILMLGPPFCLSDGEADVLVERTADAVRSAA